jgi:hypothetical protein
VSVVVWTYIAIGLWQDLGAKQGLFARIELFSHHSVNTLFLWKIFREFLCNHRIRRCILASILAKPTDFAADFLVLGQGFGDTCAKQP